jgi:hypothetical protein
MAAIDIAGMKSAFGYQPEDEEEAKPAAPETGVIDVAGMKQYFSAMPAKEKPAAPMFGVQFAPEKAAKVSESAKRFLAEQPSIGQVAAETGQGLASMADVVAGIVPMVAGTGTYAVSRALQKTPEEATKLQQAVEAPLSQPVGKLFGITEQPGYQQSAANKLMQFVGENLEKGAGYIAQQTGLPQADVQNMINSLTFVAPQTVKGTAGALKGGAERVAAMAPEVSPEAQAAFTAAPEVAALRRGEMTPEQIAQAPANVQQAAGLLRNAGAAQTTTPNLVQAAIQGASPELQQVVSGIPVNKINMPVLERHIEADTLPIPMRLTEGMATQDPIIISREQNMRGRSPELAQRFNELNADLVDNMGAIRDIAAPDVFVNTKKENSAAIMDSYRAMDDARRGEITQAYKALEDANGGQFPIDIQTAIQNADAKLRTKLKSEFVPPAIDRQLESFRQGAPMTFEQFEALRTNLAAEIRKAERSGDGNAAMASSMIREALEDLPLTGQAANLKGLADTARSLAKDRFDTIKKDPAYKAVIDEKVSDRDFFDKYVINGVDKNIQTMMTNLSGDPLVQQHLMRGTLQHLSDKAGLTEQGGTFSQSNYNKAVKHLADTNNLDTIFTPEVGTHLRTLGNVAYYTMYQPKGSFVNNSNTLVAALAERAKGMATTGLDIATTKVGLPPMGTVLSTMGEAAEARRAAKQSLAPAAGVTAPRTPIRNMVPPQRNP